jgi:hypothetical protein
MAFGAHRDPAFEEADQVAIVRRLAPEVRAAHPGGHVLRLDRDVALDFFLSASVVKRKAPVSTLRVARKMPFSSTRSIWNFAFSPSFTVLPSPNLQPHARVVPVRSWSFDWSTVPGVSGTLRPSRSSHAGYCTASTTAGAAWSVE